MNHTPDPTWGNPRVRIDRDTYQKIREVAATRGQTIGTAATRAIETYLHSVTAYLHADHVVVEDGDTSYRVDAPEAAELLGRLKAEGVRVVKRVYPSGEHLGLGQKDA